MFGDDEGQAASNMIAGAVEESKKRAHALIKVARDAFEALDEAVREAARSRGASEAAERHRRGQFDPAHATNLTTCPSCETLAPLSGEVIRLSEPRVADDVIAYTAYILPTRLRCAACGLDLHGYELLQAIGLGGQFTSETSDDPADYYGLDRDLESDWEPDYGND